MPSFSCAEVYGVNAYKRKAFQQNHLRNDLRMPDAQEILVANLRALMQASPETHGTQAKLAERSGVNQTTVGRILRKRHHPTTEVIQGLAEAFEVQPWQLLAPGLKAQRVLSPFARDIAELLDSNLDARDAREAIRTEAIHRFGPGSELDEVIRRDESPTPADTTPRHLPASGTLAAKARGRS